MVDVCKRVLGKSHCWWNLVLSGVGEVKRKKQPCRLRSKDFTVVTSSLVLKNKSKNKTNSKVSFPAVDFTICLQEGKSKQV